jgi:hypothetical protein
VEQKEVVGSFESLAEATALMRLFTPVAKAVCSKRAIIGLQECMESLGGVGYLEDEQEFNVARLFRDANVLSIWEGTTEVMATDVVRVITGRGGKDVRKALDGWVRRHVSSWGSAWSREEEAVRAELGLLEEWWSKLNAQELAYKGREIMDRLAWIAAAIMLVEDARRDDDRVASALARRWIARGSVKSSTQNNWKEEAEIDRLIAFPSVVILEQAPAKL